MCGTLTAHGSRGDGDSDSFDAAVILASVLLGGLSTVLNLALGNALIFHSVDHMASLFIHAGPFLTCWGLLDAAPPRHPATIEDPMTQTVTAWTRCTTVVDPTEVQPR